MHNARTYHIPCNIYENIYDEGKKAFRIITGNPKLISHNTG